MLFHEDPNNTAARASNGPERSRWRDEGVDPELVTDPFDVACEVRRRSEAAERIVVLQQAERPLSAMVAVGVPGHPLARELDS